jgi:hypothetical protein
VRIVQDGCDKTLQVGRRMRAVEEVCAEHIVSAPLAGELERELLEEQLVNKLARHRFLELVMRQALQIGQPFPIHLAKVNCQA